MWRASPGNFSSLKTRNGSRVGSHFGRNRPLWEVRRLGISTRGPSRDLSVEPQSWFESRFLVSQKTSKSEHSKNLFRKSRSGSTKNACCLTRLVSRICFSPQEKCTLQKCVFFGMLASLIFARCFSTICDTVVEENEKTQGDRNWFLETPWPIVRLRGVEISVRDMCHKTAAEPLQHRRAPLEPSPLVHEHAPDFIIGPTEPVRAQPPQPALRCRLRHTKR